MSCSNMVFVYLKCTQTGTRNNLRNFKYPVFTTQNGPLNLVRFKASHTYTHTHTYIHLLYGVLLYIPFSRCVDPIYKASCVALRTGPDSESNTAQHVCCKSNYYSPPLNSGADPQSPKAIMRLGEGRRESHTEKKQEKKREIGQQVNFVLFLVHTASQCHWH